MSITIIDSYLVALGAKVDEPSFARFEGVLNTTQNTVAGSVKGILGDFLKFQVGVTGALTAAGFGVIGFIEKLAMSDQQMRLFSMRSFMTIEQARGVQTALKALNATIDDVSWDKELHQRFMTLIQDQRQLSAMLGPQYEKQMEDVRDVWFQLQRLEVKGEYFGMKFASDLLAKMGFGEGGILLQLQRLNDFVLKNMPEWSDELSTDVLPVLRDFWMILSDLGHLAGDLALEFTNLVGVFSGDSAIEGTTFDFHKFAQAVEKVAHWLAIVVHYMLRTEQILSRFAPLIGGAVGGGGIGGTIGTVLGGIAGIEGGPLGIAAGAVAGGATGTSIGAWTGGVTGAAVTALEEWKRSRAGGGNTAATGPASGIMAQARALAQRVSAQTGLPADLIFAQWAHETGNFTNRGTTQLNNLAGIRMPGSTQYRQFASTGDFADFYGKLLESKRYTSQGINAATTPEAFAHALKSGGYYEATEREYATGMRRFQPEYGGGGSAISVGSIVVHVPASAHSPEMIASAVKEGVRTGLGDQNRRAMTESGGAYQ